MKRKRGSGLPKLLRLVMVGAALAGVGWYFAHRRAESTAPLPTASVPKAAQSEPLSIAIERVDPAKEGRRVIVSGVLRASTPPRDPELGISPANAIALLRQVEMRQWRETCRAAACEYALAWSDKPIPWHAFRTTSGHANSIPFPFSSQRFPASGLRLGAFNVDPALVADASTPIAYPVHVAQLPLNLAATFREEGGVLYTGVAGTPARAGDLRISYRIVPAGEQHLSAIQKGERLVAPPR